MSKAELIFLGTGASTGIPVVGCACSGCISSDPRDRRLRTSALIRIDDKNYLIDAGPDFRQQALREGIKGLDGILLTHAHYDHTAGLDEMRPLISKGGVIPLLLSRETYREVYARFGYLFHPNYPYFNPMVVEEGEGSVEFAALKVGYATYYQREMPVLGFRFGKLAYLSDVKNFKPTLFDFLEGVETLVISALRESSSEVHITIDEAVQIVQQVGAKRGYLIHMGHEVRHGDVKLPDGIELAVDGLRIGFTYE